MKLQLLFIIVLSLNFFSSCSNDSKTTDTSIKTVLDLNNIKPSDMTTDQNGRSELKGIIKTIHGNIIFNFYPKQAPNTVIRIIKLIQSGFYDGLVFHRVIPNFVVQGGDPTGTGTGGSGIKLKSEFNSIQHIKGTIAMARSADKDSADSQFYIALSTLPHLDGNYTVFAQVISGFNSLEKITKGDKILSMAIIQ